MGSVSERVALRASRLKIGKDFGSPKELEEYLKKHPDADRTKHKVDKAKAPKGPDAKPSSKPPAPKAPVAPLKSKAPPKPEAKPEGKKPPPIPDAAKKKPAKPEGREHKDDHSDEEHPAKPERRFDGWKKTLKGLKESAAKFVEAAPKALKSFLGDPDFRKHALQEATDAATKLPKKAVHRLVETAKEEVQEFKTAGAGIKAVMSGQKMSKHQKHAFRKVATHMAIGAAATAFAATGPLAGAAVFSKNLATHVALKSVTKALGNMHTMSELNHIGHGVMHLLGHIASEDGSKEIDPEEAMTNLILASVAKVIEQLSDDDFTQVLNGIGDEGEGEGDSEKADKTAALAVLRRYQRGQ